MARQITEQHQFTREEIEAILKFCAKNQIINGFYRGDFRSRMSRGMKRPEPRL